MTEYPRLPFALNRARKLSDADIDEIRRIKKELGWANVTIAKKYGVSKNAILYWVNHDSRENTLLRGRAYKNALWKNDPEYRAKSKQNNRKVNQRIREVFPQVKTYFHERNAEWRKNHPGYGARKHREWATKNPERNKQLKHEHYMRNRDYYVRKAVEAKRRRRALAVA